MNNCSNCGTSLDGKPKVCEKCGRPTRLNSPGLFGAGHLGHVIGCIMFSGVMFAILYPVFLSAKPVAKQVAQTSVAKQVAVGTFIYLADFDDTFPIFIASQDAATKFEKYLVQDELKWAAKTYTWNLDLSGARIGSIENTDSLWMFYSSKMDGGKRVVAYVDGHCKALEEEQFRLSMNVKPKFSESSK